MQPELWQRFQHPAVRALAWARWSAPLTVNMNGALNMADALAAPVEHDLAFFQQLEQDPAPLEQHLATCHSHRLGIYFESLWAFYLSHHPNYQLLSHDLQVFNADRRTLGAFDFIYQYQPDQSIHHLEVAIKFYLYVGGGEERIAEQSLWPGPNPKDTLHNKVERMQNHQLQLASTHEGHSALSEAGIEAVDTRTAALKGYLFYPWQLELPTPHWATPETHRAQWLPADQLPELTAHYPDSKWLLLEKRRWLGPVQVAKEEQPLNTSELHEAIDQTLRHFPLMIARVDSGSGGELERFFVVPKDWWREAVDHLTGHLSE